MPSNQAPAPTNRDLAALAGYAAFAALLLSPLRHYVGPDQAGQQSQK